MAKLLFFCLVLMGAHLYASDVSSNPGAVNISTGTGQLGEKVLMLLPEWGVRVGGLWIPDYNYLFTGGLHPHRGGGNNLFILNINLDTEKLKLWKGGLFGAEFLQHNGNAINVDAGTLQGYNSLQALPPINRSELYQIWFRQALFDDKLILRIGKTIPSYDFNNVIRPIPTKDESLGIPATTGLIYTPIFVNSSMLGVLPGYYDSAYGITVSFLPTDQFYFSYGFYDGNLARGIPTGLRGPEFNGYYFQIGEIGYWWKISDQFPGEIALGGWGQTGKLTAMGKRHHPVHENGIQGFYLFGTQRLWFQHPGKDASGINGFIQYGINDSKTLMMNQFYGGGLTFLGLIPCRPKDSMGCGFALAKINPRIFYRKYELIAQVYSQTHLFGDVYLLGALSYIPTPGAMPHLQSAWIGTGRIIALF